MKILLILKKTIIILSLFGLYACDTHEEQSTNDSALKAPYLTSKASEAQKRFKSRLNDTGITFAGNHPRTVNDDCKGSIDTSDDWNFDEQFERLDMPGQDCSFGRDHERPNHEDGDVGFSFVKIGAGGQALGAQAQQWDCVLDKVSGLMWEVKHNDEGLHSSKTTFSWYSTFEDNHGGNVGDWGRDNLGCYNYDKNNPATFCNTQSFMKRVNQQGLCSYQDWKVPSYHELSSIIHYGRIEPAIDITYFPHTKSAAYWTETATAGSPELARMVSFKFGLGIFTYKADRHHVRLVRVHKSAE